MGKKMLDFGCSRPQVILNVLLVAHVIATSVSSLSVNSSEHRSDSHVQSLSQTNKTDCDNVCLTAECVHAAFHTLDRMDFSVNPCNDFYSFACGNFLRNTVIPDDKELVNIFTIIGDKTNNQLRTLIDTKIDPNDPAPFNMAKKFYKTCMNESLTENHGLQPLLRTFERLGGWPVVKGDQWNSDSKWNWIGVVKEMRNIGYSADYIIGVKAEPNLQNSSAQIIGIDVATTILKEYLTTGLNDNVSHVYKKYMTDVAVIFGADRTRAEQELNETFDFEIKLTAIGFSMAEAELNFLKLHEVQQNYTYVQWVEYINALLPQPLSVDDNETVWLKSPQNFESLGQLLDETPNRVIANYLIWRITDYSIFYMTKELQKLKFDFTKIGSGRQEQQKHWKNCIYSAGQKLPIALSAMYVQEYFHEYSKEAIVDMTVRIHKTLEDLLKMSDWMDEETRQKALKKFTKMHTHVGYSDELANISLIEKYYENVEIDESSFLSFDLSLNSFEQKKALRKLKVSVDRRDWTSRFPVFQVNALYKHVENGIQFPNAILQDHIFSAHRPQFLNFGGIGSIIGHEMTHSLDDIGSRFDAEGNFADWWSLKTKENYMRKSRCIINYYSNYTEPKTGLRLNGFKSQSENIADFGGIKASYLAYQNWVKENGAEKNLPGLNFTPQQLFWILAAQNWCSVIRPESMKKSIREDPHIPGEFRVLGTFSNQKEFAQDFQCPEGSPMNPLAKCDFW